MTYNVIIGPGTLMTYSQCNNRARSSNNLVYVIIGPGTVMTYSRNNRARYRIQTDKCVFTLFNKRKISTNAYTSTAC